VTLMERTEDTMQRQRRRLHLWAMTTVFVLALGLLAACGGSDDNATSTGEGSPTSVAQSTDAATATEKSGAAEPSATEGEQATESSPATTKEGAKPPTSEENAATPTEQAEDDATATSADSGQRLVGSASV